MASDNFKLMILEQRVDAMRRGLEAIAKDESTLSARDAVRRLLLDDTELSLRRTGRSTRALLDAANRAAAGERIVYVVPNDAMRDFAMDLLGKHFAHPEATRQRWGLRFPVGMLEVSTKAGDLHGSKVAVVYDHAWETRR